MRTKEMYFHFIFDSSLTDSTHPNHHKLLYVCIHTYLYVTNSVMSFNSVVSFSTHQSQGSLYR
jgi:hypothetical protein